MSKNKKSPALVGQTLLIILVWLGWAALMVCCPKPFATPFLRAVVRIGMLLIPAYLLLQKSEISLLKGWYLQANWRKGVATGLVVGVLFLAFSYFTQWRTTGIVWQLPLKWDTWFNWIIGSPFAEEVWFRAILFNALRRQFSDSYALIISALLFGLLHLPVWIIVDGMSAALILQSFGTIVLYGLVFAFLFKRTGSLWAALIPHWLNNLFIQGFLG